MKKVLSMIVATAVVVVNAAFVTGCTDTAADIDIYQSVQADVTDAAAADRLLKSRKNKLKGRTYTKTGSVEFSTDPVLTVHCI